MDVNNLFGSRDIRLKILDFLKFVPDKTMLKIEYKLKIGKKNKKSVFLSCKTHKIYL